MVNAKLIGSYIISVVIILLIVAFIDLGMVFDQIAKFGVIESLIGFFLVLFSYLFRAKVWQYLLLPFGKVSFKDSFHITVIGFFINNFLPLRAGEVARAFLLNKKYVIGKLKIFSTIIVERIVEGLTLVIIFLVALFFIPNISAELIGLLVLFSLIFLILFFAFIFSNITKQFLRKIFGSSKFFQEKISVFFEELFIGERAIKKGVKENIMIWGSTFILWGFLFALYCLVASVLGIQVGFFELAVILAISSLSTVIPSAPGYIGTFEAGFVLAFAAFGLSAEQAISMAVIVHLLIVIATTILGFFSINQTGISLKDLSRLGSKAKQ